MFVVEKSTWNKLLFSKITYKCKYGFIHKRYTNLQKKIHKGYHSHVPYKDYLIIVYGKELSSKQTNFFHQKFLIDTNGKISGRILLLLLLTKIDIYWNMDVYRGKKVLLESGSLHPACVVVQKGKIIQVHESYELPENLDKKR